VVIISSFATILHPQLAATDAAKIYSEADWSPLTLQNAYAYGVNAYFVSKIMAERTAWDFVATQKPRLSLNTINPPHDLRPCTISRPVIEIREHFKLIAY
jgi:hypothetical protein